MLKSNSDGHRDEGILYCHSFPPFLLSFTLVLHSTLASHGFLLLLLLFLLLWRPVLVYVTPATGADSHTRVY